MINIQEQTARCLTLYIDLLNMIGDAICPEQVAWDEAHAVNEMMKRDMEIHEVIALTLAMMDHVQRTSERTTINVGTVRTVGIIASAAAVYESLKA